MDNFERRIALIYSANCIITKNKIIQWVYPMCSISLSFGTFCTFRVPIMLLRKSEMSTKNLEHLGEKKGRHFKNHIHKQAATHK
jgi:hypothetical protein